ncbi:MAG TPA: aminotransferase class I/II-fold pyridoxal phosphate-dependent enzyme [Candidatus Saccharimonadales bacterium]|nr:aminotransferase class I/II-fold pyridoxal phosphate-dependent enzyme [Candidatus Saccharimonadales bacterium]
MEPSLRLKEFSTYAFAEVDKAKDDARSSGFRILDFGVGDPTEPLYEGAIRGIQSGAEKHKSSGYPSYIGMKEFRASAAEWINRRFGVAVNPQTQVTTTAGSKEAVFHLPFAFINPGDGVLMPSIGYPPYKAGTVFAGGTPEFYQLKEENNFLPDLGEIEATLERNKRIKIMWINYPNNPTTVMANDKILRGIVDLSSKYGFMIASDEAYTEMYINERPHSVLEYAQDLSNLIVLQSLSKRSNATGIRLGFAVGGEGIIGSYRKLRTQIDSGVANAIQEAGVAALQDETHVGKMRELYDKKRDVITGALWEKGIKYWAESTFYIWAKTGPGSIEFAKRMLRLDEANKTGINVTPGGMLAIGDAPNANNYVRFALVPSLEETQLAAEMIRDHL